MYTNCCPLTLPLPLKRSGVFNCSLYPNLHYYGCRRSRCSVGKGFRDCSRDGTRDRDREQKSGGVTKKQSVWGLRPGAGGDTEMPFGNHTVNNKPFKVSTCITFYCSCITEAILWWPQSAVIHILGNAPLPRASISAVPWHHYNPTACKAFPIGHKLTHLRALVGQT